MGRVSADGVRRPIAIRVAASACAQNSGGVVRMSVSLSGGAVTFKGGSISNSTAWVRPARVARPARRGKVCCAVRHGRWKARTVRRTHAAASGVRRTAACGRSGACEYAFLYRCRRADPIGTRSAAQQRARGVRRTMRLHSSCTAWRGFPTEGCMHRGILCAEAAYRPGAAPGACGTRCGMRYAMCMLHRRALARCIGARWRVASARVARCTGLRRMLHAANAQPSRSARSCSPLCSVRCACASRSGEGRAFAAAERRRGALVRSPSAACSSWTRAPRCSTPWRYPAPQQGCVRVGLVRSGAGVGGRGATADCNTRGCVGVCAARRRRGAHVRWRRDVQGRLDLEHQRGGACAQRELRVPAPWYGMLRGAARPMDGAHGAAHACCGEWCTAYGRMRPEWSM
jgi:hypothetical protein